jgi:outer membrane protein assembly factor BamB
MDGVWALKESDGSELWFTPIDAMRRPDQNNGASGTPTYDDGKLYAVSSKGKLVRLDAKTGGIDWSVDMVKAYGGKIPQWGYTESPLVDGNRVVATPGNDTTLVALDKETGKEIWKTTGQGTDDAGHASITKAEIAGRMQYVQLLKGGVVGVNVSDGGFLWRYDTLARTTANCSTPIVSGDLVYAAAAYNKGGGAAKITKSGDKFEAKELYFEQKYQNHHGGMVLIDGYLYGECSGKLGCIELATGKQAWTTNKVQKGSTTFADGHLYCRNEGGADVILVESNPKEFIEKGRFAQADRSKEKAWPHPVIANGKLYLRDQDILLCYNVAATKN